MFLFWIRNIAPLALITFLIGIFPQVGGAGSQIPGNESEAMAAFYRGNYPEAAIEYERLLDMDKNAPERIDDWAAVLMAQDDYAGALKILKQYKRPGLMAVEAGMASGDFDFSKQRLLRMLKDPGAPDQTRIYLGLIYYLEGNYAKAAEQYWQVKDLQPSQGAVHLMMGRAFRSLATKESVERDYFTKRAKEEYNRAITVDPSLWQVHRDLALMAADSEQIGKALQHWKRVKSTIGNAEEIRSAVAELQAKLPEPTITPTPEAMVIKAAPQPPEFDPVEIRPWTRQSDETQIKVGLGNQLASLTFGCTGPWRAVDHHGRLFWEGREKKGYRIQQDLKGRWWLKSWDGKPFKRIRKKIVLEPVRSDDAMAVFELYQSSGYFWSVGKRKTRYYRGALQVNPARRKLQLINRISLEEYLLSVAPGEMPALWPMEALKAQVVVARTDTLMRRGTHRKHGYDVCNNAHCAMYKGVTAEHERTHLAVVETRGLVLKTDKDKLHPAFYSHSCGGMTQSNQEAWWDKIPDCHEPGGVYDLDGNSPNCRSLPLRPGEINAWLSESPGVFCNTPEYSAPRNFRWLKILTQAELTGVLDHRYGIGPVKTIRITERSPSAYVRKIVVNGERGDVTIRGDRIRSAMGGLRSNLFTLIPIADFSGNTALPYGWLVWGGGWGHGVGLCQVGAGQMGREGYSCLEILRHYFPKGRVAPWQ